MYRNLLFSCGDRIRAASKHHRRSLTPLLALCLTGYVLLLPSFATRAVDPTPSSLRVLIVGGGPALEHNQVAIESNVRYVTRLLPPGTPKTTLCG